MHRLIFTISSNDTFFGTSEKISIYELHVHHYIPRKEKRCEIIQYSFSIIQFFSIRLTYELSCIIFAAFRKFERFYSFLYERNLAFILQIALLANLIIGQSNIFHVTSAM